MDNLVNILDSFHPGWRERKYVDNFIAILKELIIPTYSFLDTRIENNKAILPKGVGSDNLCFERGAFF